MITGNLRKLKPTAFQNENGDVITEESKIREFCKSYAETLFDDSRDEAVNKNVGNDELKGPEIIQSEMENALRAMKNGKALGHDDIHAEALKLMELRILADLFNKIYKTGQIPKHWMKSTFIALPKVDGRGIRVIQNLYRGKTAEIQIGNSTTEEFQVRQGVSQGCILSPMLFNLYMEKVFRIALENINIGVKVNGRQINNLRYSDDTALMTDIVEELQRLLDTINDVGWCAIRIGHKCEKD